MNKTVKPKAAVIGVGSEQGLGGALCKRFAVEGHHVFIGGRSIDKLTLLASVIEQNGATATPVVCDATSEQSVVRFFDTVDAEGEGKLDLVVYNVGNSTPGKIREMEAGYFTSAWRTICFGGFLVGREVTRRILPGGGTIIFTGASASLRGRAGFAAFNSGKSALRTFAQAMAKEYGAEGIHVGHVIIDGGIAGEKGFSRVDTEPDENQLKRYISLEGLTDTYWNIYKQKPQAWTFEIDIRTSIEAW